MVENLDELKSALKFAEEHHLKILVLGGGSNILLTHEFEGLVIQIANKGITVIFESDNQVVCEVAAGENWHQFVRKSLENGWFGLENLSLIPGSVGAAPMQNIGAYGAEAGQWIESVQWLDRETGETHWTNATECRFGYRESIFKQELKEKAIIWMVRFHLLKMSQPKIEYGDIKKILAERGIHQPSPVEVSEAVIAIRKSKLPDPDEVGNAGSFFKNPMVPKSVFSIISSQFPQVPHFPVDENQVKIPAAWLIETAGWKGKNFGQYGVHDKQALVLVNYGGANGKQILKLARAIQGDVLKKFQIELQMEVNLV